jgi:hypothetical protein
MNVGQITVVVRCRSIPKIVVDKTQAALKTELKLIMSRFNERWYPSCTYTEQLPMYRSSYLTKYVIVFPAVIYFQRTPMRIHLVCSLLSLTLKRTPTPHTLQPTPPIHPHYFSLHHVLDQILRFKDKPKFPGPTPFVNPFGPNIGAYSSGTQLNCKFALPC